MSRIDLTIVIVNYNGASVLAPCLDAVFSSQGTLSFEVIVVDNASQDNSLEILDDYSSQILLIKNDVNGGFSRGNNQGASQGSGRYVFLLNNDTIVDTDMFQTCLDYYDAHPTIGALGPRLLNQDRTIQRTGGILGQHQYRSHHPSEVSFLSGAALMLSREMWDRVGGLDEHYFFYNEDLDLCKMIQKQGAKLVYLPQGLLVHLGGVSTTTRRPESVFEGYRGGMYFCKKHYPWVVYLLYRSLLLCVLVPSLIYSVLLSLFFRDRMAYVHVYLKLMFIGIS